jgi:hypothetical protein
VSEVFPTSAHPLLRLAAAVTPPQNFDDPYLVEVRLLNMSAVVEEYEVILRPHHASVSERHLTHSLNVLPSGDARLTVPVLPNELTAAYLDISARSLHTKGSAQLRVLLPGGENESISLDNESISHESKSAVDAPAHGAPQQFALLSDHPIEHDDDMFRYHDVADRLADLVLDTRAVTPFTIGIQGGWGTGKSSLMRLLRLAIEDRAQGQRGRVRVAWFNAWTAEGASSLTPLIRSVLEQLDPSVLRRILRRTRRSSWLAAPFVILASWIGLRGLADDLWQQFRVDPSQRDQIRKEIQSAVSAWANKNQPLDSRRLLVVFIDDLDRCSPENIIQVLEAIRLYLDAAGLVFVIGYDHAIVSDALGSMKEAAASLRRDYLEKIIQVDYVIPVPETAQTLELARRCARTCGVAQLLVDQDLNLLVERSDRNPRRLKRFLNTFVLSHQLDDRTSRLQPEEHIKMLLIRMYFPELFRSILVEPGRDVLGQLIELARLRAAVRAGTDFDESTLGWLCTVTGVAQPTSGESSESVLARLEKDAPELVVTLSRDSYLFSLAWSLGTPDQRASLLERTRDRLPVFEQYTDDRFRQPTICGTCGTAVTAGQQFCPKCDAYLAAGGMGIPHPESEWLTAAPNQLGDVDSAG